MTPSRRCSITTPTTPQIHPAVALDGQNLVLLMCRRNTSSSTTASRCDAGAPGVHQKRFEHAEQPWRKTQQIADQMTIAAVDTQLRASNAHRLADDLAGFLRRTQQALSSMRDWHQHCEQEQFAKLEQDKFILQAMCSNLSNTIGAVQLLSSDKVL